MHMRFLDRVKVLLASDPPHHHNKRRRDDQDRVLVEGLARKDAILKGELEADEAYFGGKRKVVGKK